MSTGCQKDRKTEIQTDRQTDRYKTERLFSLVIRIKVVQNVTRLSKSHYATMSECDLSAKLPKCQYRYIRAAKDPALVLFF